MLRFSDEEYDDAFITTIGVDFKLKTIEMDSKILKLQIWDTAGQERFKAITRAYYRDTHGVIIVYDITDKESFDNIKQWLFEVDQWCGDNVSILIVGNKSDLADRREVSYEEASSFAEELQIEYIETSAKNATNIDEAFHRMAKTIKSKQVEMYPKRPDSSIGGDLDSKPLISGSDDYTKRCCVLL